MPIELWRAALLGVLEGATEFIPVSSTGHLIIASDWLGMTGERGKTFDIFIQLGAILAIVWVYRARLLAMTGAARRDPVSRRFFINVGIAFLPAAIIGLLTHEWIKSVLFQPTVVAVALIVGGIAILAIERWQPPERVATVGAMTFRDALGVGLAQVLSLIPGTSRSGATIMGGYALGLSRVVATEFSFFLAIPVMLAATAYDLLKSWEHLAPADLPMFAVGFLVAYVSAIVVVRGFLVYVARHTFTVFAWYRIAFGALLLVLHL